MKNLFKLLLLSAFYFPVLKAQDTIPTHEEITLEAYLKNDLSLWDQAIEQIKTLPPSLERSLLLAETAYGAAGTVFSEEDRTPAAAYLEIAQQELEAILEEDKQHASAHGLLSGVLGMCIALDPNQGMRLGQLSGRHANKALRFGSEDPTALREAGGQLLYTPVQWGGDPEEGLELLQRAESLYDKTLAGKDWRYLNTLTLLGQALSMTEQKEAARSVYLRALALQPDFTYVKYYLLPALDQ
ncbi:MAG: tetratricopeptide repeat protein [Bacteroidota bacterium]